MQILLSNPNNSENNQNIRDRLNNTIESYLTKNCRNEQEAQNSIQRFHTVHDLLEM